MAPVTRRRAAGLAGLALLALGLPARAAGPGRIVCLDGSATEIFYLLGAEDRLVATDLTSTYPPAAAASCWIVAGGVAEKIRAVAGIVGKAEQGERLAEDVVRRFAAADQAVKATASRPKVLFLLDLGKGAPLAGGRETSADAMIRLAGGINAVDSVAGFRPVSTEAIVAAAPDVVLVMAHVAERLGGPAGVAALSPIDQTPAGRHGRVLAMDALYLLGFGPRSPEAVMDLARGLHPEMAPAQ